MLIGEIIKRTHKDLEMLESIIDKMGGNPPQPKNTGILEDMPARLLTCYNKLVCIPTE